MTVRHHLDALPEPIPEDPVGEQRIAVLRTLAAVMEDNIAYYNSPGIERTPDL